MKLKAGIIGLGVGEAHIEGYQSHPDCEVTHLCDLSATKLNEVGQKYPTLQLTQDANEILENPDIDVVSIASYDNFHFEQMKKAIETGKHTFVEKPMCLQEKEAGILRQLLNAKPELKISSNLILRRSPRFLRLREMIQKGEFGQLYYLEADYLYGRLNKITEGWRGQIDYYSIVYGGSVHLVDLLLWLTGDTVEEVQAYGNKMVTANTSFKYNDCVVAILKFKSGMLAKITANFGCVHPHYHQVSIYGTQATFQNGPKSGLLFKSSDKNAAPEEIHDAYPGARKGDLIQDFIDSILNDQHAQVSREDVFKTMSVCFAIEKASLNPGPVKVQYF